MHLYALVISAGLSLPFLVAVFRPLELAFPARPGQRFFRPNNRVIPLERQVEQRPWIMLVFITAEMEHRGAQPLLKHLLNRRVTLLEGRKSISAKKPRRRFRKDTQRRLGNDTETPFSANQKRVKVHTR